MCNYSETNAVQLESYYFPSELDCFVFPLTYHVGFQKLKIEQALASTNPCVSCYYKPIKVLSAHELSTSSWELLLSGQIVTTVGVCSIESDVLNGYTFICSTHMPPLLDGKVVHHTNFPHLCLTPVF